MLVIFNLVTGPGVPSAGAEAGVGGEVDVGSAGGTTAGADVGLRGINGAPGVEGGEVP